MTADILMSIGAAGLSDASAELLKDFAIAIAIASVGLVLARAVRQPPVLGYLVAGLIIGPYTLSSPLISNLDTIGLLAELGLVLLLFGIGLELGWRRIRSIGFQVLLIGVLEISVLTLLGVWIASILPGLDGSHGLYLGGAIAISSSAILLKGLRDGGNLNSSWGRTIVGILLVEDFAAVIFLTVLAGLATTGSADLADAGWLVGKLGVFCVVVLVFGTLLGPKLMRLLSKSSSDETLLLACLGLCFLMALGATTLGLSAAAGAFLVGVVIGDTQASERVIHLVSPVRDLFGALFFLSIGMLIDYHSLGEFIVPALVVVAVFMVGKIAANTVGSLLAGRRPGDAARVGMTMPQMGEFSLAIGRLSPSNVAGGVSPLGAILSIATAITSVLAPLTARSSPPLCDWLARHSPQALSGTILSVRLGVDTFWSALSMPGHTGERLRQVGRSILINIGIVVILAAGCTVALHAVPATVGNVLTLPQEIASQIMVGVVMGLSIPSIVGIWRSMKTLALITTTGTNLPDVGPRGLRIRLMLRTMVQNGLAAVFLALLFVLFLPLILSLIALGNLSTPLSLLLLLAPALAMGIISFRVHGVLEPAFRETFTSQPVSRLGTADAGEVADAESPSQETEPQEALVVDIIERLGGEHEVWRLLESRIAFKQESEEASSDSRPTSRDHEDRGS